MTLLYLAVAFLAGIAFGRIAWDAGLISCAFPGWLWVVFVVALPFTPLLNRLDGESGTGIELRWPRSAGFTAPRMSLSPGMWAAILLCVAGGFARYAAHPLYPCLDAGDLAFWNASEAEISSDSIPEVEIEGYIWSYPSVRDTSQRIDVMVRQLTLGGSSRAVDGVARLDAGLDQGLEYGQPVQAQGVLTDPYAGDEGAYQDYLARRGIRSQLARATVTPQAGGLEGRALFRTLYRLRARGEDAVNRLLPEPYAAVANGMLLGIETGIPDDLMEQFNSTGTSHVIVISGSNVALIAGVLAGLFARLLGRRRALAPVLAGILAYALLVGGDMAVLRAALMGGLAMTAVGLGRHGAGVISLAAACWFLALLNPLTLWDVGFQLSAAATAGLMLFTPILARAAARLWPGWLGGALSSPYLTDNSGGPGSSGAPSIVRGLFEDSVVVSAAASLAVMPLIAYTFGRVSVVGTMANLLIVPVQPLITVWGSAGALAGALGATIPAQLLLWSAWPGLFWTVQVVELAARLPLSSVEVAGYGLGAMVATYALMAGLLWRRRIVGTLASVQGKPLPDWHEAARHPAVIMSSALVALLIWWGYSSLPDGRLHVHFLNVGQGDGILIETPSGRQVLVDGGSSPQMLLSELGAVMPFWDRSLDMILLTHPDGDHMDAQTQAIGRFDVEMAVTTQAALDSGDAHAWLQQAERGGVPVTAQRAGGWIDLGDGIALWVINPDANGYIGPDPDNENSLVVKLVYGDFSALLTGDAGLASEAQWLAEDAPIQSTVLKVGHHGSRTSTGESFTAAVNPQVAVIQVGADNRYGHPHEEVLSNLAGHWVLRTDILGRVHIASDGQQMWVETETQNKQTPSARDNQTGD